MLTVSILGQFYDLLNLYSLTGTPTENHCLLMNGDLVDRGSWSVEVILTAFAYKCEYVNYTKGLNTEIMCKGYTPHACSSIEVITKQKT